MELNGLRFSVLGSGSSGNSSLIQDGDFGVLVDLGFGPRKLAERFRAIGESWETPDVAVITHTHSDHVNARSVAHLIKHRIKLFCHASHQTHLEKKVESFVDLRNAGLVENYLPNKKLNIGHGIICTPFEVSHDGGKCFGFRFEVRDDMFCQGWKLGYVCDLGCWNRKIVKPLTDVDVLAMEFNHDVDLQQNSRRPMHLIERCLGNFGHLSNEQAAEYLEAILQNSQVNRIQHLVQLHLSSECNRPKLSTDAAEEVINRQNADTIIHVAEQDEAMQVVNFQEVGV